MKPSKVLILFSFFLFYSCSLFESRQFIDEMEYQWDEPMFAANEDFMVVAGDSGRAHRTRSEIMERTPATARYSEDMAYRSSLSKELQFLENKLTDQEFEDYQHYKNKLGNTSQKIYFLRLSASERSSYLRSRGISTIETVDRTAYSPSANNNQYYNSLRGASAMTNIPKINDIVLGMSKDDVVRNWGQPERMEVAGDPSNENERWAYRKSGSIKYIYFESGRVEGWTEQ